MDNLMDMVGKGTRYKHMYMGNYFLVELEQVVAELEQVVVE
jgi:hypothetical protein